MEFEKHLSLNIRIYDTATWTFQALAGGLRRFVVSPNGRILASTSILNPTPQLWNLETGQLIGAPLHHEQDVSAATFSADGKFLVTCCSDRYIYTWDVSAIVKEAGLPSDIVSIQIPFILEDTYNASRLMLHHDQPEKQQVLVEYLQGSLTTHCERLMYAIYIYH
jgi:WD40 repeat protein